MRGTSRVAEDLFDLRKDFAAWRYLVFWRHESCAWVVYEVYHPANKRAVLHSCSYSYHSGSCIMYVRDTFQLRESLLSWN